MADATNPSKALLSSLCSELLGLIMSLSKETVGTDAEALAMKADGMIRDLERNGQAAGLSLEDLRLASYALVALIDERIMTSDLPISAAWADKPLQLRRFDDLAAGEEFYNKLDLVRHTPGKMDVTEIYYLCLALGFTGRLADARGLERRRLLLDQLRGEISTSRGSDGSRLSRLDGAPSAPGPTLLPVMAPPWLLPVALAAGLAILALALWLWVGTATSVITTV